MLNSKDKKYIVSLVQRFIPVILDEIGFDPTVKEVGHSYHGPFEHLMVKKLMEEDSDFTEPTMTRSPDDVKYKNQYINIKFGYDKHGQPNICSMHRLFKYLHEETIDSYYLLSVDALGPVVHFFDVYDYLDCTNFNYGTGQLMLNESLLKEVYVPTTVSDLSREEKLIKIGQMMRNELDRHISQKLDQQKRIDLLVDEYVDRVKRLNKVYDLKTYMPKELKKSS